MPLPKSSPAALALFERIAPVDERVQRKPMFGYPACFAGGNLFASLFHDDVVLKLGEADRAEILALGARPFEPRPGREMRPFVVTPKGMTEAALKKWALRALEFGASLPKKKKKATAPKRRSRSPSGSVRR